MKVIRGNCPGLEMLDLWWIKTADCDAVASILASYGDKLRMANISGSFSEKNSRMVTSNCPHVRLTISSCRLLSLPVIKALGENVLEIEVYAVDSSADMEPEHIQELFSRSTALCKLKLGCSILNTNFQLTFINRASSIRNLELCFELNLFSFNCIAQKVTLHETIKLWINKEYLDGVLQQLIFNSKMLRKIFLKLPIGDPDVEED